MSQLKTIRGFLPYISVVFLNAFVDLGHKIVIQNTIFKTYSGQEQVVLTAIINGLILLPFILLFSPSGFLADRFSKPRIIRHAALAAVGATLAITYAYYQGWFWASFVLTLALAVQSAIYSPAKYGYIKELAGKENLATANGTVQAITIAGILLGTLVFSAMFEALLAPVAATATSPGELMTAIAPIGWVLVALSVMEWLFALRLPLLKEGTPGPAFKVTSYLKLNYLRDNLGIISSNNAIKLSIIGLSTFWAIAQVMLAAFPAFAKETLDINNTIIIQGILACTGVGIALGSVIAGRLSRNYIETGLIPVAALGISLGIALLPGLENPYTMAAAFLLVGVMGGMFIVPLNAIIQFQAEESRLGTILAGNNWVQNVAMLAALGLTASFAILGIDSVQLFYILALVAVIGTGYTVAHLPHSLARILATAILKRRYRIDVVGFENLPQAGPTLLLGNHISWIDWALVQIACPRPLRFVMFRGIYELWYLKPFFKAFGVVPIAAGRSKDSIKTISALLQKGECVCLFPEGAISRNGHLGKFHTGYERMVEGIEDGVIIPFYLHGLWGSSFSRAEQGLREARAPSTRRDLIVAFGKPLSFATQADQLKQKVFELSISAWSSYTQSLNSIPQSWLQTARANASQVALIDSTGTRLSNLQMVATVSCISKAMGLKDGNPNVGVLLPAGPAVAIANLAIQLRGKAAVQLNYTATPSAISAAISDSGVTRVITSRAFLEQLLKRDLDIAALAGDSVELVFMEDLQNAVPRWKLVSTMIQFRLLPLRWYFRLHGESVAVDAPAAILFSNDSGDRPQGIVLSHRNIIANSKQVSDVLNTRVDDVVMSCLPCFHSFGLIVTTMMPLLEGIPAVCHPDPTDTLAISKLVAKYQATILAGTASVLSLYANNKKIHPLMLNSLRLVIASAGGLSEEVRNGFQTRFGKTIYKGYGPTQTAPVVSANIPDAMDTSDWKIQVGNKPGSVGMPLPGTSIRVVDPDSLDELALGEEGLILFCGNQVMLGYLNDEKLTNESIVEVDDLRWYKTRDRGHLTDDGFLVIADGY